MANVNSGYDSKGGYNGYNKNNSDREQNDFYATPPQEVANILTLEPIGNVKTVLEPCCGAGHMLDPINQHMISKDFKGAVIGTDIIDRGYNSAYVKYGEEFNFLSDSYPFVNNIDTIVMNPPYDMIEDFTLKALDLAKKKIIMLARTQFSESQTRYENIFKHKPPTRIYQYVDRIACYKNGDFSKKQSSAQSYSWFVWDLENPTDTTTFHWMRRSDKL